MNPDGQQGEQGQQGDPPTNGAGGKGGKGGKGGDAERSEWTDRRLEDKFETLIDSIGDGVAVANKAIAISTKIIWLFVGILISTCLLLLAALVGLALQYA